MDTNRKNVDEIKDMTVADLLNSVILPFEIYDEKLKRLFSFFLHSAPTIDSKTAAQISEERLEQNWNNYIALFEENSYCFLSANCSMEKYLGEYNLESFCKIKRKSKAFVCKLKNSQEKDCVCFLRHIRNAIAHNNVYLINSGNRKFVLFVDFNSSKKPSSRILLSQTDLQCLKKEIMK